MSTEERDNLRAWDFVFAIEGGAVISYECDHRPEDVLPLALDSRSRCRTAEIHEPKGHAAATRYVARVRPACPSAAPSYSASFEPSDPQLKTG